MKRYFAYTMIVVIVFSLIGCQMEEEIKASKNIIENTTQKEIIASKEEKKNDNSTQEKEASVLESKNEVNYIKANTSKKGTYLTEGIFQGGEITDGKAVKNIRWGSHEDFERIVIDFDNNDIAPYFTVESYKYPYSTVIELHGVRRFLPKLPYKTNSDLVDKVYPIMTCDDSAFRFGVIFKKPIMVEVFELKNPARVVVDIKESEEALDLSKVYSLRTGPYEYSEYLVHVEGSLRSTSGENKTRILIDDNNKYLVEEGYYNSKEEADKRKKEIEVKDIEYKLYIEEIKINNR